MNNEIIEMLKKALDENDMGGMICGGGIIDIDNKEDSEPADIIKYLTNNYKKTDTVQQVIIQELIPINKPMKTKEIADYINDKMSCHYCTYQKVYNTLCDRVNFRSITKTEPYEYTYQDDNKTITVKEEKPVTYWTRIR